MATTRTILQLLPGFPVIPTNRSESGSLPNFTENTVNPSMQIINHTNTYPDLPSFLLWGAITMAVGLICVCYLKRNCNRRRAGYEAIGNQRQPQKAKSKQVQWASVMVQAKSESESESSVDGNQIKVERHTARKERRNGSGDKKQKLPRTCSAADANEADTELDSGEENTDRYAIGVRAST